MACRIARERLATDHLRRSEIPITFAKVDLASGRGASRRWRRTPLPALMLLVAAATISPTSPAADTVAPPIIDIARTTAELASVEIVGGAAASGYNLYRGRRYVTTVRPTPGTAGVSVTVGRDGGEYCLVAFEETADETSYSVCSAFVTVPPVDPATPVDPSAGLPTAPVNLRASVYSPGVAELFWERADDDGRVAGYRVVRDGVVLAETDRRNLFQPELEPDVLYRYAVLAIDDEGNEGPAATVDLRANLGTPPPPPATGDEPAPPANLRGVAYSRGTLEIFWDRSPDEASLAGYAVTRDGESIAFLLGRSVFQSGLDPERTFDYEVSAVGTNGVHSSPLRFALRADPSEPVPPAGDGDYAVATDPPEIRVPEGDRGLEVALHVERPNGGRRPLTLSIPGASDETPGALQVRLEPTTLGSYDTSSRLTLELPIAMAPRLPARDELVLRIDDGLRTVDVALPIALDPIDAPDVYLLIGQSNMEGYSERGAKRAGPGELDEPVARVRQLNVIENNPAFFPDDADYTLESSNLAEPLLIRAEDPLHNRLWPGQPTKSGTAIGPALAFGKAALGTTTRSVYLVPAAWGATGFCAGANGARAWNAEPFTDPALGGTLLLERALLRLDVTLRETGGVLRGILWHQGGADANTPRCAELYADNLVAMVRRLRSEAREDPRGATARGADAPIPFVVATQSRGADERADFSVYSASKRQVDDVHRSVAELIPHADVVINDDLVPPAYPCGQSSCVHFGAAAMREQGARFHEALERIRGRRVP